MRSRGRRNPSSRASAAEPETRPSPISSNVALHGRERPARLPLELAQEQLLAAAPPGDDADACLDEPHGGLGVRLDRVAVQQHLAAASESTPARRADHGDGCALEAGEGVLAAAAECLQPLPVGRVREQEDVRDVGADGEVRRVVVQHEGAVTAVAEVGGQLGQREDIGVDRVHLRRELEAEDAVAHVPERRRGVACERADRRLRSSRRMTPGGRASGRREPLETSSCSSPDSRG